MKILRIVVLALISIVPLAADADNSDADNPDVRDFKVFGVQLGMGEEDAIVALAEHFSINPDDLKVTRFPDAMPITEYIGAIDFVEYSGQDLQILMTFSPDLDRESDGCMVVGEPLQCAAPGFAEDLFLVSALQCYSSRI